MVSAVCMPSGSTCRMSNVISAVCDTLQRTDQAMVIGPDASAIRVWRPSARGTFTARRSEAGRSHRSTRSIITSAESTTRASPMRSIGPLPAASAIALSNPMARVHSAIRIDAHTSAEKPTVFSKPRISIQSSRAPSPITYPSIGTNRYRTRGVISDIADVCTADNANDACRVGTARAMQASDSPLRPNGLGVTTTSSSRAISARGLPIASNSVKTSRAVILAMPGCWAQQAQHTKARHTDVCTMVRRFAGILSWRTDTMQSLQRSFLFLVSCWLLGVTLHAQEIQSTVVVDMQTLTLDQRQDLVNMARDVENYINNNRYLDKDWDGDKIPVDITIYIRARNGNRVSARLAVVSKRLINGQPGSGSGLFRIFDQEWSFEWSMTPTLVYQTMRYDDFASVIDFYMLMAIGLDMDTYDDLAGTPAYKIAQQIAQSGNARGVSQFSTMYQPGEFTRMSLVSEFMDIRYQGMRRLIYDYHDAIDTYAKDKAAGITALEAVVHDIAEFKRNKLSNRSVMMQAFFDAKQVELAGLFRGNKTSNVWTDLRYVDPGYTQQYEAARDGR
ncbi:MAG: DUF4835 family protein [Candidatus Kapabacteria bacterium]|nr:DUF4835 family protein [Candidatus Kapabacteria bacterium]